MQRAAVAEAVKRTAVTADRLDRSGEGVVVLIYHRVGGRSGLEVDLPTSLFDEQLAWLREHATLLRLDEATGVLLGQRPAPRRPVVVTFDDGTADFVDVALPVLVRHQVPATIYVATSYLDEGKHFPAEGAPMTWGGAREAVSTGLVDIGSHTHSHALFDRLPPADVAGELDRSLELIAEQAGVVARHFAYPKALLGSPAAEHAVRRRFDTAAIAGTRPNVPLRTDLHRLHRSPVQVADGMRWFEQKALGGMWLEDSLRRLLNRWRYHGSTT